jgi:hypothetical protein
MRMGLFHLPRDQCPQETRETLPPQAERNPRKRAKTTVVPLSGPFKNTKGVASDEVKADNSLSSRTAKVRDDPEPWADDMLLPTLDTFLVGDCLPFAMNAQKHISTLLRLDHARGWRIQISKRPPLPPESVMNSAAIAARRAPH